MADTSFSFDQLLYYTPKLDGQEQSIILTGSGDKIGSTEKEHSAAEEAD